MNETNPTAPAAATTASPIAPEPGNLPAAVVAGLLAALVGAVLWALITVQTKTQIGFMALGVGFLVAWAVRRFGRGQERAYGVIGAVCALLGCVLGNLLSACGFLAASQGRSVFDELAPVLGDAGMISRLLQATFDPMDLLFYAIAVYEGFKLARRPLGAPAAPAATSPGAR